MAIQVLLRRNIEGVGQVGQVVRVRNGYARNYLIPNGYAALVTPDAMLRIDKDKKTEAVRQAEESRERSQLAEVLAGITLTVEARAGEDGHLYGSVGPRQLAEALRREGFPIDARQIRTDTLRELGEYSVPVHLSREHVVPVKLWVVQDRATAAAEAAERAAQAEREAAEGASAPGAAPAAPKA